MRPPCYNLLISISIAIILPVLGCAHEPRGVKAPFEERTQLSEDEVSRCEQVAWEAVNSPEMLERFKPERITQDPFKFSKQGISCYLDRETFDTIEVAVPSGGYAALHGCFLGVTLKRDTYEVMSMKESCWP